MKALAKIRLLLEQGQSHFLKNRWRGFDAKERSSGLGEDRKNLQGASPSLVRADFETNGIFSTQLQKSRGNLGAFQRIELTLDYAGGRSHGFRRPARDEGRIDNIPGGVGQSPLGGREENSIGPGWFG